MVSPRRPNGGHGGCEIGSRQSCVRSARSAPKSQRVRRRPRADRLTAFGPVASAAHHQPPSPAPLPDAPVHERSDLRICRCLLITFIRPSLVSPIADRIPWHVSTRCLRRPGCQWDTGTERARSNLDPEVGSPCRMLRINAEARQGCAFSTTTTSHHEGLLRQLPALAGVAPEAVDNAGPIVDYAHAVAVAYAYELRRGGEIVSTGRLTVEEELQPGDELTLASGVARIEELGWLNGEPRLMLRESVALAGTSRSR
jgi:hypothetical protein